jgi:hypothetical protein
VLAPISNLNGEKREDMKVLNLDSLEKVEKSVTLKGVTHAVVEMSVEDFIAANAEAKRLEELQADPTATADENLSAMVRHLARVLPTIGVEELRKLKLSQLQALVQFVNGVLTEELEHATTEQEGADPKA